MSSFNKEKFKGFWIEKKKFKGKATRFVILLNTCVALKLVTWDDGTCNLFKQNW